MKRSQATTAGGVIFIGMAMIPGMLLACSLDVQREAPDRVVPTVGGQDILVVTFTQTHRHCSVPIEKTEMKGDGIKILGVTPWTEIKSGTFQRKLKVKYERIGTNGVQVVRSCPRGGDETVLSVSVP